MNIIEKLKQFNVEVTPDMEKAFSGEFLSEKEVEKKISKAENDRDSWKQRAETAEETLKGFEGKDLSAMQKEIDDWKEKATKAESEYNAKMAEHEKQELLKEAFAEVEFTSESAKKAIMAQIAEGVSVKNGKLIGFNDLLEDAKKNDASAFVNKEQQDLEQNKARFTQPMNNQNGGKSGKQILSEMTLDERIKMKANDPEGYKALLGN
ncbi:MAG: phage scaffolding protein [Lachnospiraceae bacterium]|nr:phage scaffolding protein [Lachnospiraceae bacterium]